MTDTDLLKFVLNQFAELSENDFAISTNFWHKKQFKKGEFYNRQKSVCEYLGFIIDGVFRSYIIEEKKETEKNVFFYTQNQFVVTFKSFINRVPCDYHTQAMTDATVIYISLGDLLSLYKVSHKWETFGRLLAQQAFLIAVERTESLIFQTAEERYSTLQKNHPTIFQTIPLYHISSYLGIQGPSLSRIRRRISGK